MPLSWHLNLSQSNKSLSIVSLRGCFRGQWQKAEETSGATPRVVLFRRLHVLQRGCAERARIGERAPRRRPITHPQPASRQDQWWWAGADGPTDSLAACRAKHTPATPRKRRLRRQLFAQIPQHDCHGVIADCAKSHIQVCQICSCWVCTCTRPRRPASRRFCYFLQIASSSFCQ